MCPVKSLFQSGMWFWIGCSIRHLYILDITDSWSTHKGLAFFVCKPRKKYISSNSGQITMIDGVTNCFDRFDLKRLPFYTLYNNHNLINKAYLILSHFPSSKGHSPMPNLSHISFTDQGGFLIFNHLNHFALIAF